MATPTYEQIIAKQQSVKDTALKQGYTEQQAQSLADNWLSGAKKQYGYTDSGQQKSYVDMKYQVGTNMATSGFLEDDKGYYSLFDDSNQTPYYTDASAAPATGSGGATAGAGAAAAPTALDQAQADYYKALADKANEAPEKVTQQVMRPGYATSLGQQLASKYASGFSSYTPGQAYTGNLNQTATSQEQQGLSLLDQYLSGGKSALSTAAESQALSTLNGQYTNAETNPYIQSLITLSNRNLQSNMDTLNRQRAALGKYFTSETIAQGNKATTNAQQNLDAQIAQGLNQERQNQVGMVGTASNLSTAADNAAQNKIAASQTYGSLRRMIEAGNLENAYKAWLNQRSEQQSALGQAGQIATDNPQYGLMSWYA